MAKKATSPKKIISKATVHKTVAAPVSTPVRNTAIPKVTPIKKEITYDQIAKRAFEIHCSGTGGSETDNWHRAERELRGF